MSISNTPAASPTFDEIRTHLLEIDPGLRTQTLEPVVIPAELLALETVNTKGFCHRPYVSGKSDVVVMYAGLCRADH